MQQADDAFEKGNLDAARHAYEQALKAGAMLREDFKRARSLGLCYLNGGQPHLTEAATWLQTAWRLRPDDEGTELLLAQALAWNRHFDESAAHYRTLFAAHQDNSEYALGLARALDDAGSAAEALTTLESFLEGHPGSSTIRLQYAALLGYSKQYAAAVGQYNQVLEFDPHNVVAEVGIAKVTSWQGHLDVALGLYDKILRAHPGLYDALVGKAFTLMWMNKTEEARPLFEAAARKNPADREVARALRSLGPRSEPHAIATQTLPAAAVPESPSLPAIEAAAQSDSNRSAEPPTIPVEPVDPTRAATQAAESATARGDYTAAVEQYRTVLKMRDDAITRLRLARVLSWSQQYEGALAEYALVIERLDSNTAPEPGLSLPEVRLEYARVLSWARRFDASLKQLSLLLPAGHQLEAKDRLALLERAKVLSWAGRYQESVDAYDQAIALQPDFDTRMDRAQVQYWSGVLRSSLSALMALRREQPTNPRLNFLLAAVERASGSNGRALAYLSHAPLDEETGKLRSGIRKQLRPVLSLRTGLENDREFDGTGPHTTIKVLRYSGSLMFYARPDLPLEVTTTVAQGLTSNPSLQRFGNEGWATESLIRTTLGVTSWLRLGAGAGGGTSGGGTTASGELSRQYHFVYDLHPIITLGAFRLDVGASQHVADYTPLAIHNNVVQRRESISPAYTWRKRLRLGTEYWHADYSIQNPATNTSSFSTGANGGSVSAMAIIARGERFNLEAGPRFEVFGFDDDAADMIRALGSSGFFTPRLYERIAAAANLNWNPQPPIHVDVSGTVGPQRIFGFASLGAPPAVFCNVGSLGVQFGYDVRSFTPIIRYEAFSSATAAFVTPGVLGNGSYRSQTLTLGLNHRF